MSILVLGLVPHEYTGSSSGSIEQPHSKVEEVNEAANVSRDDEDDGEDGLGNTDTGNKHKD